MISWIPKNFIKYNPDWSLRWFEGHSDLDISTCTLKKINNIKLRDNLKNIFKISQWVQVQLLFEEILSDHLFISNIAFDKKAKFSLGPH